MTRNVAILLTCLLLAGCATTSPSPVEELPPVVPLRMPVAPRPIPGAPLVEQTEQGVLIRGLRNDRSVWYAGGQRLAFETETGLWSVAPDGSMLELLLPAHSGRQVLGGLGDTLVYLEPVAAGPEAPRDRLVAGLVRPGAPPQRLTVLEQPGVAALGYPIWTQLQGGTLVVAAEGADPLVVDLRKGSVRRVGDQPLPVRHGEVSASPFGRYLAFRDPGETTGVRILDLERGSVTPAAEEPQRRGVVWSPLDLHWAVLAGSPEAGQIDLGTESGEITHLRPPTPLTLTEGPYWSPDGGRLAVLAGPTLWVVTLESGDWHQAGRLGAADTFGGFHPDGRSLVVHVASGTELWPLDPGRFQESTEPAPLPHPWALGAGGPIQLPDRSLLYLGSEPAPRLYLQRGESEPVVILADETEKGRLTAGGTHLAVAVYRREFQPDLLIMKIPR